MKKLNGQRTEYLSNYLKYGFEGERKATYQGPMQERLTSLYKEIKSLGFEVSEMYEYKADNEKNYFVKDYKKNDYEEIIIYIFPDGLTVEINYKYKL